jgi:hypothetical protein
MEASLPLEVLPPHTLHALKNKFLILFDSPGKGAILINDDFHIINCD